MKSDSAAATPSPWANVRVEIRSDATLPLLAPTELWAYREVLFALVWRELKVRYAQTIAGASWVLLQPLLTTVILNFLAGRWMNGRVDRLPYALFAYSGLVPWMYFVHVLTKTTGSLINTGLLSKVYFPRLLLPLATAIGGLLDMLVASAALAGLMIYFSVPLSASLVLMPFALVLTLVISFGIGVWLAVLNLFHRDVAHALPFATQLLFFVTPVAYPIDLVPSPWQLLYSVNPMVAVLEVWRWSLFGGPLKASPAQLAISLAVGSVITIGGLWYFSRHERTFADVGET